MKPFVFFFIEYPVCGVIGSCKRFKVAWFVYVTKLLTQRFTVIYTSKLVLLTDICVTQTMLETYSLRHHSLHCRMLWTCKKDVPVWNNMRIFIVGWTIPYLFLIYLIRDISVTFFNNFVSRAFWSWLDKRSVESFESRMKSDSVRK